MRPLFSVVTPSYNQGPFIRATIESVLSQDYPDVEYIIMDGGSTDETPSVAKDYSSRLTFISEKDRGQSDAINKGFRMARGSVLAWLNSDDLFLPGMISAAVNGFEKNPLAGAVYGEGYLIDLAGNTTKRFPATEPFNLWKLLYLSDYVLQQTVAFRRDVLDDVGYLREDLHFVMDWDILIRIALKYPLEYIPSYMGCLREYPEAKSFSGGAKRIRELRKMLQERTGMLIPPGYITYGLDTYKKIWSRQVDRAMGPWAPSFAGTLTSKLQSKADAIITRVSQKAQGLYADGWAAPLLRYMLPPEPGGLRVAGDLPGIEALRGQRVEIIANRRSIGVVSIPAGEFQFDIEVPQQIAGELLHLEFKAARWFEPGPADPRRLSYRVKSIGRTRVEAKAESVVA